MNKKIICFGEILWDMLPQGKQPGGAPMNVAYHLNRLGLNAYPFTAVGQDDLGKELVEFLTSKNISNRHIQENDYPTGKVLVRLNEKNEASYTIESPSAWDFIHVSDQDNAMLRRESPIVVFGSLACRHTVSHQSLLTILGFAGLKICDINLRPPFYNQELVFQLLGMADWIKINHEELNRIGQWLDLKTEREADQARLVLDRFPNASMILITRGDRGAAYYGREGKSYEHPGFKVDVVDTVGSGDSFLAMFISCHLAGNTVPHCLEASCAMGAVVAKHEGATALFDIEKEISELIKDDA